MLTRVINRWELITINRHSYKKDVGSAVENPSGTYTVTHGSDVVNLPASNVILNGQKGWRNGFNGGDFNADSYAVTNVLALGGVTPGGDPFAGFSGTTSSAPTASATFTGRYSLAETDRSAHSAPLTLNFDASEGRLSNVGGNLTVAAVASGGDLAGTVNYGGDEATLSGGFYGTNKVAGAFNGDTYGGVLYGTR